MRKSYIIPLILCLFLMASCGKSITEEAEQEETEQPITPPDDGGGDDGNDDGGDDDGGSGGGSDDGGSGGGSDDGGGSGGSDDGGGGIETGDIVSVNQFLTNKVLQVYVRGYVIGDIEVSWSRARFESPFRESPVAVLLADDPNERDKNNIIYVKLNKAKGERSEFSLYLHPENLYRKVRIWASSCGNSYGMYGIDQIDALHYWDE